MTEGVPPRSQSVLNDPERVLLEAFLDDRAPHNRRGPLSLRWIYVHMIEEPARHADHGDILWEQIRPV